MELKNSYIQNLLFSDNDPNMFSRSQPELNLSGSLKLVWTFERVEIRKQDEPNLGGIYVNFSSPQMIQRCQSGLKYSNEALIRAVGVRGIYCPNVLDATAGLGSDAFLLASAGCYVTMLERNPVVAALLEDGLRRAYRDARLNDWIKDRLVLNHISGSNNLSSITPSPDVVYLDPMYPHRSKTAKPKKEMRILRLLVGQDSDSDELLIPARMLAKERVVVKRPRYANPLGDARPHASILSKKHRFDIYRPVSNMERAKNQADNTVLAQEKYINKVASFQRDQEQSSLL